MYKDISKVGKNVTDLEALNNSIRNILTTSRGSVPGKPKFGSSLYNIIFSHLDHLTESIARNYVEEALSEFEGRIVVEDIIFKRVEEFNRLNIEIVYTYRDASFNNQIAKVSVPFNL